MLCLIRGKEVGRQVGGNFKLVVVDYSAVLIDLLASISLVKSPG